MIQLSRFKPVVPVLVLICLTIWLLAFANAQAGSFASSVSGLTIPNAHLLARGAGEVYRGQAPLGKASELTAKGVTDILIFKNETRDEVKRELAELQSNGFTPDRIHHIPVHWDRVTDPVTACEQVIQGLAIVENAYRTPGRSVFFHCTSGEDRTGMLAGIFRMVEEGWNVRQAFEDEMCARGYEAGDRGKPAKVVGLVRANLTPLFLRLATMIEDGVIRVGELDTGVCQHAAESRYEAREFVCGKR